MILKLVSTLPLCKLHTVCDLCPHHCYILWLLTGQHLIIVIIIIFFICSTLNFLWDIPCTIDIFPVKSVLLHDNITITFYPSRCFTL